MNIADVSLAIGMGLAAGVVITGILIITWFLASAIPAAPNASPVHE